MKKFSNISNVEVGKEPEVKIDEKAQKIQEFKHSVLKLMDDFLSIRSFGSARPEIMIPTQIVGKDLFVEALHDLLTQQENKEVVKLLESLKTEIKDWKAIDAKIDEIQSDKRNVIEERKIMQILERWNTDQDNLTVFLKQYKNKLSDSQIKSKSDCLERMIKNSTDKDIQTKLIIFRDELNR